MASDLQEATQPTAVSTEVEPKSVSLAETASQSSSKTADSTEEPVPSAAKEEEEDDSSGEKANSRQLKKTCEACARSKVKCEGGQPCERCNKRGCDCVYLKEQKRGRRMGSVQDTENSKRMQMDEANKIMQGRVYSVLHHDQLRQLQMHHLIQQQQQQQQQPNFIYTQTPVRSMGVMPPAAYAQPQQVYQQSFEYQNPTAMAPSWNSPPILVASNQSMFQFPPAMPTVTKPPFFTPSMHPMLPSIPQAPVQQLAPQSLPNGFQGQVRSPLEQLAEMAEQRMTRTLLALFKYHHHGQPTNAFRKQWFDIRLGFIWGMVSGRLSPDECFMFATWLTDHKIAVDGSINFMAMGQCVPEFANIRNQHRQPYTKVGVRLGSAHLDSSGSVDCSADFCASFGYTATEIKSFNTVMGFLPFGADVISIISGEDQEAFVYIQEAAAAVQNAIQSQANRATWHCRTSFRNKSSTRMDGVVVGETTVSKQGDELVLGPVNMTFFLPDPDHVFTQTEPHVLGPWFGWKSPGSLARLLAWVDSSQ